MLTVGELFAGIGGIGLGLERTGGFEVRWQVEQDEYCRKVLTKHWPDVKRYGRVEDVGAHNLEPVDLICGGFPCQDISSSGTKRGVRDGQRSGLWGEMSRIVRELRPRLVLVENVADLRIRGLGEVLGDLARIGYDAEWESLPAAALGLPQRRIRLFVVAYPDGWRLQKRPERNGTRPLYFTRPHPDGLDEAQQRTREAPRRLRGMDDGLPGTVDRLRALGNAVVPQVAEWIGRRILEAARVTPAVLERTREEE